MNKISIDCKVSIEINKIKQESKLDNNDEANEYNANIHKVIKKSSNKLKWISTKKKE